MTARLSDQPLFLVLLGVAAASMLLPALVALGHQDYLAARSFFYAGLMGIFVAWLIGIARGRSTGPDKARGDLFGLVALLAAYVILPAYLALPFYESLRSTAFLNAYVEMVSSLTTTGATFFTDPGRLSPTLELWRAQVGWMGGFLVWVAAAAVLAPLNLGGFEVTSAAKHVLPGTTFDRFERAGILRRVRRVSLQLAPIYGGLTAALWVLLLINGESALTGLCHAMSTLSTSGISNVGGMENAQAGLAGEMVIFLFLIFALSRVSFVNDTAVSRTILHRDPELRLGALIVIGVPLMLFLRHWIAAFEVDSGENLIQGLRALWGALFTVLSFLSTTGFESADWEAARLWSGLGTPGIILMGLAIMGGGVATTAGGVKLLRVYALYLNGLHEMRRLVHPSAVSGAGAAERRMGRQGAFHAWIYFMLFAMSLALLMLLLSLFGQTFEEATILAVSALTTTGPLLNLATDTPILLQELSTEAKLVFAGGTVLGRLELVAIIALFNPDLWRD